MPKEIEAGGTVSYSGKWLVNADSKGANNGIGLTISQTSKGADDRPKSKRGRQRARADKKPNFKRADNGPGLTMSQK